MHFVKISLCTAYRFLRRLYLSFILTYCLILLSIVRISYNRKDRHLEDEGLDGSFHKNGLENKSDLPLEKRTVYLRDTP
jgi:hypothetical protein